MKKKINVIDLDNTLLPYNSWMKFVILLVGNWHCFLPILYYSFLRGIGILSRGTYQKNILMVARQTNSFENTVKTFGESLYQDVRTPLVRFVLENTDETTINIVCTASPEDYVKYLCEKLGWRYVCSTLDRDGTHFVHMFRGRKITAIQELYPYQEFIYHLAISDDTGDLRLLRLFEKYYVIHKGRWQ